VFVDIRLAAYLPQDRRAALARGETLPDRMQGAALFADISGFTPLTEMLAAQLGPRRGAEALTQHLDRVYDALIIEVERFGGSVIGFAGDSILCWFADEGRTTKDERPTSEQAEVPSSFVISHSSAAQRAVACALALQQAMQQFVAIALPNGTTTALALKVAVASGPARRFVVGDPAIQLIDALAGATIARTASAEHQATKGEILIDEPTATALGDAIQISEWRADLEMGARFGVVTTTDGRRPTADDPQLRWSVVDGLSSELLRPWLLPAVYAREQAGHGAFLTEFRPAVALFVRFEGIDYDADRAADQLDTFIRRAQGILARADGTLLQLTIGDKGSYLYAVFGAPTAHEDDARRAVHAAMALRSAADDLGFLAPIQIGISRGIMRAGASGSATRRTYAVLGDDVNLAARLMSQAARGEILVSGRVHTAIADVFACEPRPPIALKGKAERVPIFAVSGAQQQRAIRLQEPSYALPMIGRERELALIEAKLVLAGQEQGQIVGITGEAGIGKSRLLAEAIRLARRRQFTGYGGACQSDGVNSAYLVWRPIASALFDLDPAAPLRKQIRALEDALEDLAPARINALPLLGTLLGLNVSDNEFTRGLAPKDRKSTLEALLVDCLTSTAREAAGDGGGLLLVLEDLHWIDPASHDLLEEIARASATLPILIVLAYRPPELQRLQPPRVEALDHFTKVTLAELQADEAEQAIRAKLAQLFPARERAVPPALVARLTAKAQGNPFYLEELLNYVHDRGIDPRDAAALDQIALPDSLHTLILSRIDQLSSRQQLTLKVASVIGRQFGFAHLRDAYPVLGEEEGLKAELETLARLDLTPLDISEPELAYLFKHIVTHEVAYESLVYATRATLHEQYARFVEAQVDDVERYLDLLAFHYDRTENLAKRREYLRRAGEAAEAAYANDAALDYYARLLPLLTEVREQLDVHIQVGAVLEVMGSFTDAEARCRAALALAKQIGDAAVQARCQLNLGLVLHRRGELDAALALQEQARATWEMLGDQDGLSRVVIEIGRIYHARHEHTAAERHLEEGVALGRAVGNTFVVALGLDLLGSVALEQGDVTAARARYEESLAMWRARGDKYWIAWMLTNLGRLAFAQGDYTAGQELDEASQAMFRAIGARWGLANALMNAGYNATAQGNIEGARVLFAESLAVSRTSGFKANIAQMLLNLGFSALTQGDIAVAQACCEESLELFRAIGDNMGTANVLGTLGGVALAQGEVVLARELCEESLVLHRASGDKYSIAWVLGWLGEIALEEGDTAVARARYEEGLALSRAIGNKWGGAEYTLSLGLVARAEGQLDQAALLFAEGLAQCHTLGVKQSLATGLAGLALVAADRAAGAQDIAFAERAARLGGATAALLEALQAPLDRQFRKPYEEATTTARTILGDEAFPTAWEAGKQLTLDEAVAFALAPEAGAS
jgi:class 3 adenylate cyclase/tetratricopeptide (TPR) repeat protein